MKTIFFFISLFISSQLIAAPPSQADREARFVDNKGRWMKPRNQKSERVRNVSLGQPRYGGNGCPAGTASISMTEDKKTLSILFDKFITEAGAGADQRNSRTECRMIIPISAPEGYRMTVAQLDYRGFNSLPARARATFSATHQIRSLIIGNGVLGPRVISRQRFMGPIDDEFIVSAQVENNALPIRVPIGIGRRIVNPVVGNALDRCGGPMELDIETQVFVQTNQSGEFTSMSLDSVDANVREGVNFHLMWERCL